MRMWIAVAVIIVAGALSYSNSFEGGFFDTDDVEALVENDHIQSLWPISEAISLPLWGSGSTLSGRPILSISFAINYALTGGSPWGYHLGNLIIHLIAGLILFGIIRRTLCMEKFAQRYKQLSVWMAMVVSLIWITHPLQTESVTYMVQRAESLAGTFYLLTLYCIIRGAGSVRKKYWYFAAAISCALGMGTKEMMVTAPFVVGLYDYVFLSGSLKKLWAKRRWLYIALISTIAIQVLLFMLSGMLNDHLYKSAFSYAATQPKIILYYMRLAVWPDSMVMIYYWPIAQKFIEIAPYAVIIIAMLSLSLYGIYRKHWLGFLGGWFFLILIPSSSFQPLADNATEHRMYLSLAAIVVIFVIAAEYLLRKIRIIRLRQGIAICLTALVVIALGCRTYNRNKDYKNAITFWSDNVQKQPKAHRPHLFLGNAYFKKGTDEDINKAIEQYRIAIQLKPYYPEIYNYLAMALEKQNDWKQAEECFRRAIEINPKIGIFYYNYGVLLIKKGDLSGAKSCFKEAIRINRRNVYARNDLAYILLMQKNYDLAEEYYKSALKISPNNISSLNGVVAALIRKQEWDQAKVLCKRALKIAPQNPDTNSNMADICLNTGDVAGAVNYYNRMLSINSNPETMTKLAWALVASQQSSLRNGKKAMQLAKYACDITNYKIPRYIAILAATYAEVGRFAEAIETSQMALELTKSPKIKQIIANQLAMYRAGKSIHMP